MAINITIHPIKGLDGTAVRSATILPSGALQFDRQWAFVEADGRFVNGKNCPSIHGVRAAFDLDEMTVELNGTVLSLQKQTGDLVTWMSERLGQRVSLRSNEAGGFPDDTEATGPTVR